IPLGATGISKTISAWLIPERCLASRSPANITAIGLLKALLHSSPVIRLAKPSVSLSAKPPLLITISLFHHTKKVTTKTRATKPDQTSTLFKVIFFILIFGVWGKNALICLLFLSFRLCRHLSCDIFLQFAGKRYGRSEIPPFHLTASCSHQRLILPF